MLFFIKVAEKHPEGVFQFLAESVEGDLESADGDLQLSPFFTSDKGNTCLSKVMTIS